jgi:hypothetical protein
LSTPSRSPEVFTVPAVGYSASQHRTLPVGVDPTAGSTTSDGPATEIEMLSAADDPDAFIAEVRAVVHGEAPTPVWNYEAFLDLISDGDVHAPAAVAAVPGAATAFDS